MKLRSLVPLAVLAALLCTSCEGLFENQFLKWGLATAPTVTSDELTATETSSDDLVSWAYTSTGKPEQAFFDALMADPIATTAVLATLETTYTSADSTAEQIQAAAALSAEIQLETSGASEIVGSVASVVGNIPTDGSEIDTSAVISDLVESLSEMTPTEFSDAVTAITNLASGTAISALGTSIGSDGIAEVDSSLVASAAEAAIIATIVDSIDLAQVGADNGGATYANVTDLLSLYVDDDAGNDPLIKPTAIDLPATASGLDPSVYNLILAASLDGVVNTLLENL